MYSINLDFENKNGLTEESIDLSRDAFIEEAKKAGMICTKIDFDLVNVSHPDKDIFVNFIKSLDK